jgi:hypothetical protein
MASLSREEEARLAAEALRRNDRYLREVVEGLNVCPFARGARVSGRAVREVILHDRCEVAALTDVVERYERGPVEIEIVQLILPRVTAGARDFEACVAAIRAERASRPGTGLFALAAFHPDFVLDARNPHTAVPFFRRSPDPTIQLVRLSTLDALSCHDAMNTEVIARFLRGGEPPPLSLSARITRDNYEHILRDGGAAIAAIYASIAHDRR